MNTALDAAARTELLLKEMTLDEKLQLTFGYFSTKAEWQRSPIKNWQMPKDGLPDSAGPAMTRCTGKPPNSGDVAT